MEMCILFFAHTVHAQADCTYKYNSESLFGAREPLEWNNCILVILIHVNTYYD